MIPAKLRPQPRVEHFVEVPAEDIESFMRDLRRQRDARRIVAAPSLSGYVVSYTIPAV